MRGRTPEPKTATVKSIKRGFPPEPADLSQGARAEWGRIRKSMGSQLIGHLDAAVLRSYCEDVATYIEAQGKLQTEGKVIASPKGYPIENPWLWIAERAKKGLLKSAAELGLTPVARTRVGVDEHHEDPNKAKYFKPGFLSPGYRELKIAE